MKISNYVWCIVNGNYMPSIGNGKQFQHPVFPTKKEAKEFLNENHGWKGNPVIKKCEIRFID